MSGFTKESTAFLAALAKNNTREWFGAHKDDYEAYIKHPAKVFSEDMRLALEAMTGMDHRKKVFRIYRDIRFSKDKSPYNSHISMSFMPDTQNAAMPGWYMRLTADQLVLGTGVFAYDKANLEHWRERIAGKDGAKFSKILNGLTAKGLRLGKPDLKRVPAGFDKDHPRADLLRFKGLTVWKDFSSPAPILGSAAAQTCLPHFKTLKPVFDWMSTLANKGH